jgi:hypothetical protein
METVARITDRTLGYLGLFLIGAISWVADHVGEAREPAPSVGARRPSRPRVPAGPLATSHRAGG